MEEAALNIADLWNIGIGISGVITTIIAVGVAIAIPAWQRKKEMEAIKSERKTYHTAILTWLRNDLWRLSDEIEEKMSGDNEFLGEISFQYDNLDHFLLDIPDSISELRKSPALLSTCPPILIRLIWHLSELEISISTIKNHFGEDDGKSTYEEMKEHFCFMHYKQISSDLDDIYELSEDLGLDIRRLCTP